MPEFYIAICVALIMAGLVGVICWVLDESMDFTDYCGLCGQGIGNNEVQVTFYTDPQRESYRHAHWDCHQESFVNGGGESPRHGDLAACGICKHPIEFFAVEQWNGLEVDVLDSWWAHVQYRPANHLHEAVPA